MLRKKTTKEEFKFFVAFNRIIFLYRNKHRMIVRLTVGDLNNFIPIFDETPKTNISNVKSIL